MEKPKKPKRVTPNSHSKNPNTQHKGVGSASKYNSLASKVYSTLDGSNYRTMGTTKKLSYPGMKDQVAKKKK